MTDRNELPPLDRLVSLDAYRGLTMLLMASYGFGLWGLLENPEWVQLHPGWAALVRQFRHPAWEGLTLWDLIFPSFLFVIGVAMPHSFQRRSAQGQSWAWQMRHAVARGLAIFAIGVLLDSYHADKFQINFPVVLQKIGVCYALAFFMLRLQPGLQWSLGILLLLVHTGAYVCYDDSASRWLPEQNVGFYIQQQWFGLPANHGNTVLNALTGTVNILFGIACGRLLLSGGSGARKLKIMIVTGVACLFLGYALSLWIPINKWLWTSSYTLVTGGFTFLTMAFFYQIVDVQGYRRWTFPLVVVGMNSILVYVVAGMFRSNLHRVVNVFIQPTPLVDMPIVRPIVESILVLALIWYLAYWLYRHRVFVKL